MLVKTKIFEKCHDRYRNLVELAGAMGISVSFLYRVKNGHRRISRPFIVGALRAFPEYGLNDLFYLSLNGGAGHDYTNPYHRERISQALRGKRYRTRNRIP